MKNKLIKTVLGLALVFGFSFGLIAATPTFAADDIDICTLKDEDGNFAVSKEIRAAAGCPGLSTQSLPETVRIILNGIIAVLGTAAVVYIVYGGVQYMTSAGDTSKLQKAKLTLIYACIGLGICALAFAITNITINIINNGTQCSAGYEYSSSTGKCVKK